MSGNLQVLCCHQPSLDPRIRWTAEFGQRSGYDTHIYGFNHKPLEPTQKPASEKTAETVFSPSDAVLSNGQVLGLMLQNGVMPRFQDMMVLLIIGVLLSPILFVWAVYRIIIKAFQLLTRALSKIFSIVKFLPKGDAIYNVTGHAFRRAYHLTLYPVLRLPPRVLRFIWRRLTHGRFTPTIEALRGYRWYFFSHSSRFAACMVQQFKSSNTRPGVLHVHDPDALLAGVLLKKIYGAKLIYDAHESGPDAYLIRPKPRYLFFAFERMLMKHVDSAVTVSAVLVEQFNARYKNHPHFHLLPNTSPKSDLHFKLSENSDITDLAKGRVAVLFQGGLAPQRGVEWVIQEWTDLNPKNAALFIRGPENEYRKILLKAAETSRLLGQSIYFLPSIAEDDLIKEANAADIGVIPYHSHVENHIGACPNKLSQYMMAELAVLATPLPFIVDILKRSGAGVTYDDTTPGDFSQKLTTLINDPDACKQHSIAAREASETWFNFEAYADILPALYTAEP